MDILKIVVIAVIAVVAVMIVRQFNSDIAVALSIGVGVLIFTLVCDKLYDVVYAFYDLSLSANIDSEAINCVVKVVGIGYLAEFSNNICVDTNNKSLGEKVLFASRIAILLCVLPIVNNLFEVIKSFVS